MGLNPEAMDYSGRMDAASVFAEINAVFKKYGVGRGVGFVPDRLEITLERAATGQCRLVYREFFSYLPPNVMDVAMGNAVEFLGGLGVPKDRIKPLDGGVKVTLEGDARIAYFPMLEMLIQDRAAASNVDVALDSLKGAVKSLVELFDFAYGWDRESETRWRNNIARLNEVIEANPSMQSEIEEIIKRHQRGSVVP